MFKPDPIETLSQWSDKHRVLGSESPEPGLWDSSRAPFQEEIANSLTSGEWRKIVVMKGSQLGLSELANNWIGHTIHRDPGPMMYLGPTQQDVEDYDEARLKPLFNLSPALRRIIGPDRGRSAKDNRNLKTFPGGFLSMAWSGSASRISSKPIRKMIIDEIDRMSLDTAGEGSPLKIAAVRLSNYWNSVLYEISTPRDKETSLIEPEYERSTREKFHVPCPSCGEKQVLVWAQIQFEFDESGLVPENVFYECRFCEHSIVEADKEVMLAGGEWISENPNSRTRGFHISSLYSPWLSWGQMAQEFLEAKAGRAEDLKVFVNTRLAETWIEKSETIAHGTLFGRREPYQAEVPNGVHRITVGVDVQHDRLELEVVGWGLNRESWQILYQVLPGKTDDPDLGAWPTLLPFIDKQYLREDGSMLPVHLTLVDSGDQAHTVYAFCVANEHRRIYPSKGMFGFDRPIAAPGKRIKTAVPGQTVMFYGIGVDVAKSVVYNNLKQVEEPGPGYCHFSMKTTEAYFRGLTVEELREKKYRGTTRKAWHTPDGARNEPLDCRVMNLAAVEITGPVFEVTQEPEPEPASTPKATPHSSGAQTYADILRRRR